MRDARCLLEFDDQRVIIGDHGPYPNSLLEKYVKDGGQVYKFLIDPMK